MNQEIYLMWSYVGYSDNIVNDRVVSLEGDRGSPETL